MWMIEISREGLGIPFRVNLFKLRSIFRSSDIYIIAIILFLPRTGVEATGKCFPESCIVFVIVWCTSCHSFFLSFFFSSHTFAL